MLIPLRTDRPARRRPVVTESLIALNVLVYLLANAGQWTGWGDAAAFVTRGEFNPRHFQSWQLVSSLFLHDPRTIWHVGLNMLFLWVFGCAVEDRLGRIWFLLFYLAGGVAGNLAHWMMSPAPVIGASGAVAAVSGAFLALFPRSQTICLWLLTFTSISVSSLWLIALYMVIDVLRQFGQLARLTDSHVAHGAHIGGYLFGFTVAFTLLGLKILPREEYDMFYLFAQSRRRAAFRAASRHQAAGMWDSAQADTGERLKKKRRPGDELTAEQQRLAQQRSEIGRLIATHDLVGAGELYRKVLIESPDCVFPESRQMDLANQLYVQGHHAHAAAAYELLLNKYPTCASAAEARLMLGLLYARKLNRPDKAREAISRARAGRLDAEHTALAEQLLAELEPT